MGRLSWGVREGFWEELESSSVFRDELTATGRGGVFGHKDATLGKRADAGRTHCSFWKALVSSTSYRSYRYLKQRDSYYWAVSRMCNVQFGGAPTSTSPGSQTSQLSHSRSPSGLARKGTALPAEGRKELKFTKKGEEMIFNNLSITWNNSWTHGNN